MKFVHLLFFHRSHPITPTNFNYPKTFETCSLINWLKERHFFLAMLQKFLVELMLQSKAPHLL